MLIQHPHFLEPVTFSVTPLSDDPDEQVAQTITLMRRYVLEDAKHPCLQAAVDQAIVAYPDESVTGAIYRWVRDRMRFVDDQTTAAALPQLQGDVIEALVRPQDMLQSIGRGDCDDYSMLVAALLLSAGIPCAFVTVAADYEFPERFSHVYVAAYPEGERIAVDASHGPFLNWETENRFDRRMEWPIAGQGLGFDWDSFIGEITDTVGNVVKARYGNPPPNTVRNANGTIIRGGDGFTYPTNPGSSSMNGLLLPVILIGGLMLLMQKRS